MRWLGSRPTTTPASAARAFPAPVPTQIVSSEEYAPAPQTAQQREVEARLGVLGTALARRHGMTRRRFFQTAAGMAAAYHVMNQVYGPLFDAPAAEAATPELADTRAGALKDQLVFDAHTHYVRDDPGRAASDPERPGSLTWQRVQISRLGWNTDLAGKAQTVEDLKIGNYVKEIFLDSDTKVALLTNAPSDDPADWLLPQDQVFRTRDAVNRELGARRLLAHFTITPGQPGWLEAVDRAIATTRPDGWKGYTIGDIVLTRGSRSAYRLDDEKLMYPFYERAARSGIRNVCVHKGVFPLPVEQRVPHLRDRAAVGDVGRAAKDWPQLNFVIYHSGFRHLGGQPSDGMEEWERAGRLSWLSDLADIPGRHGVTNVYGDLGAIFAWTVIAQPRLAAAMLGTLIKGLGADHVIWGTDSIWTGSPQWQIEGLRRLEIPEDMQRQHGFAPLGAAAGPVKSAILAANGLKLFGHPGRAALGADDGMAALKAEYERRGPARSNLRYGFVA
jgi:predicted TIM-barrel fold metal-dependent hydrolase